MALAPMRTNDRRHWTRGMRGWVVALVAALAAAVLPAAPVAAAGTASISGTVIDSWGNPSGGTGVDLYSMATYTWAGYATTAADGTYSFTGLAAGNYKVRMYGSYDRDSAPEWYPGVYSQANAAVLTVADGEVLTGIDGTLAPAGQLAGTVVDGFGNVPTGAEFWTGSYTSDWTDASIVQSNGTFWAPGVPEGAYWFRIQGPGYATQWYDEAASFAAATPILLASREIRDDFAIVLEWTGGIRGAVVDQYGAPVAGATVTASGAPGTRSVTSAADGTYRMSLPGGSYTVEFSVTSETPPYETVWYDGAASVDLATSVVVTSGAWRNGIDAQLVGDFSTISGVVTDDLGDPVVGATVDVHLGADVVGTATTDAAGSYAVGGLVAGSYLVSFEAPGHVAEFHADADRDAATPVVLGPGGDATVDAALTRAVSVSGTLTDARGLPIEATVALLEWGTGAELATVPSEPDGGYAFIDMAPGDYVVQVRTGGVMVDEYFDDALDLATALPLVLAPGDGLGGVDFVLDWSGGITGVVTDLMGTPLEGATVTALDGAVGTTTAADGSYTLPLPAGDHTVSFDSPVGGVLYRSLELPATVALGALTPLDAALTPATTTIAGTVTDDLGAPLAGVPVIISTTSGEPGVIVLTGADGTYRAYVEPGSFIVVFNGAAVGATTEAYDDAAELGSATAVVVALGEDVTGIDAQLDRLATITGTVVDDAGDPVTGASIEVLEPSGGARAVGISDENGAFAVLNLPPGSYAVRATVAGYVTVYFDGAATAPAADVVVLAPADVRTGVDFVLPWDSGLSGTVTDEADTPLAGVTVTATDGTLVRTTETEADGTYSLDLPAGAFVVGFSHGTLDLVYEDEWYDNAATADAASPVTVLLGVRTTGIDADLAEDDASITGTVTDADGAPLGSVYVVAHDRSLDVARSATTAQDGTYTIDGLEPGTYVVRFMTYYRGFSHVGEFYPGAYLEEDATPIVIGAGDDVGDVDAALASAASISGTVWDANGGTPASLSLTVRDLADGNPLLHGSVDVRPDGTFTMAGLPAGTYTLLFEAPGYVSEYYDDAATVQAATPITLAPGASATDLEVELVRSSGISGTVLDESGAPMPDVVVWVQGPAWEWTRTGPSGDYTIPLPPGDYLVGFVSESMNPVYLELFYDGATEYDLAEPVTVVADEYTTGIDAQMVVDYVVPTFTDVAPGQVFADDIAWLAENGIASGWPDGTFRPVAPVTREAMAAFLHRFVERLFAVVPLRVGFIDVTPGNPFFDDIMWTADNGIATGWPDGTFRPSLAIERQAMAAFLYRFAGSPDFEAPAVSPFADVQPGDAFYTEICWLADQGITTGTVTPSGTFFKPAEPVERQAMAAFLHRMWEGGRK